MSHRTKVWFALGTVYLIWGSTYLGIELAGETIPPLFAVGTRFVAAGLLMTTFTIRRRGARVFRLRPAELASAALVMFMTPGLAFFYGGLVRAKNVLATVMQSFIALALVSIAWTFCSSALVCFELFE